MIQGNKINLRVICEKDLAEFFALWSSITNRGGFYSLTMRTETALKKRFFENGCWGEENGELIIEDKNGAIVGTIYFKHTVTYYIGYEVGYYIFEPNNRRKGYTKEALSLFVDYLFASKPINRLDLRILPGNVASKKVAESCGFTFEGTARKAVFSHGKFQDVDWYSILREERS
jgi:RimJ/RimL family protein N-acetyltransferase